MRVDFSVNQAAKERQKLRDDFMAAEHGMLFVCCLFVGLLKRIAVFRTC